MLFQRTMATINPTPACEHPALAELIADLSRSGQLPEQAVERGQRAAEQSGIRLDRALNQLGLLSDIELTTAWARQVGLAVVSRFDLPGASVLPDLLQPRFLHNARCLPMAVDEQRVLLAVEDPLDSFAPAAVALKTRRNVELRLIAPGDLDDALKLLYPANLAEGESVAVGSDDGLASDVERLRDLASDAPVIRLVNAMIDRAVETKASDIHFVATRVGVRLRYRIDGVLADVESPPGHLHAAIVSRVKIMANLDIAERRLPQDGRIRFASRGRDLDLRLATMPHAHGEGFVLRILDRTAVALDFHALGLSPGVVNDLEQVLALPHGIVLVTGPTGSGKTTTLYAALKGLARPDVNIISVEDPVEYRLDGVNQVQVLRAIGMDFARALRATLRQDPDIIMIGEIRDRETASIAIQAALTGHLVLATIHTNTAAGALPRLIDMGCEPYLLASTVRGVLAQRLVRRLCPHCRRETRGKPVVSPLVPAAESFEAIGCGECTRGFSGRIAISEFLRMSDPIRRLLATTGDEKAFAEAAAVAGMPTLREDGFQKAADGLTTVSEVLRAAGDT